ncbi:MAG: hypothetical protein WCF88_14925 [Candidatus Acidiferrales bacterium]|jgi:hypothetical protein
MTEQSRNKRPQLAFQLHRQSTDNRRCPVVGERQILELISLGAPLPGILNKLCMMIDVRIGNVVSIISLPDRAENHLCSMTHSALQVGLEIFSSSAILSPDRMFLGVLEIFGCDQRRPTMLECHLIDRITYLAALALQRPESPEADDRADAPAIKPKGRVLGPLEKPPFIN